MELNKWASNDKLGQLALALIKIRDQDVVVFGTKQQSTSRRDERQCLSCDAVAGPDAPIMHKSCPLVDGADNPCYIAQQALLLL